VGDWTSAYPTFSGRNIKVIGGRFCPKPSTKTSAKTKCGKFKASLQLQIMKMKR
jgi:hypothetical protein